MEKNSIRTDLAVEARQLWTERSGEVTTLPGVRAEDGNRDGFPVTKVEVLDRRGEEALGKPIGVYITVELDPFFRREPDAFADAANLLGTLLRETLRLHAADSLLAVGLGNRGITPDAVGPETIDHILVTRHLKEKLPEDFARFRSVSAVCSGVLGITGIESGDLVRAVAEEVHPDAVVVFDALAARGLERLCRTVQIADTGIVPGSGVGNARRALNRDTLGVPVIAVGVPTVVDAATLTMDMASRAGVSPDPERFGPLGGMIVTARDIDKNVREVGKLLGYGLNLALHDGITIMELDSLLA